MLYAYEPICPSGLEPKGRADFDVAQSLSLVGASRPCGAVRSMSGLHRWSQAVDATLYLRSKGWSGWRWTEDMLEVSMRPRERSCGTAGSTESRSRRLGEHLASRRRRFIFRWLRMAAFVQHGGGVHGWH